MMVFEGDKLKSKLTGTNVEVKAIKSRSVVLESKEGSLQEWTDLGNLPLFFEEMEHTDPSA
jgi:hypothetical protein